MTDDASWAYHRPMNATQQIVKATKDLRNKRITADEFRSVMASLRASMTDHDYNVAKLQATRSI